MKHSNSVDINKPLEVVVKFFNDPNYMGEYQDGFVRKVLITGRESAHGAVSKIYYKNGGREMELTETITSSNLPDNFELTVHHKHMDNTMQCSFEELDPNKTRYHYKIEYTRINWVAPKLMAILFPSMYKKPVDKWMRQFRDFVERQ